MEEGLMEEGVMEMLWSRQLPPSGASLRTNTTLPVGLLELNKQRNTTF